MRVPAGALAAILALSLGVWTFFYLSPGAPLDASETAVVVGISACVVLLSRFIWGRIRGSRRGDDRPS